jgi:Tyrosine-protein kinase ephrin type A/B receptor-like
MDLSCNAGYYLTKANKCQLCPVGTISKEGVKKCTGCPAGTKTTDHLSCKTCAAGKYSGALSAKCYPCGTGKVSQPGASNCTACTAGQYASRPGNICTPCAKGTYSTGSVDSCTKCAVGSYADSGETACTPCSPGKQYTKSGCTSCYSSTYSPDPYTACTKCPAGTYSQNEATACVACDAKKGYEVNDNQDGCICPNGGVFDNVLQACSICKPGYSMIPGGGGCAACGPKTYAPRVGSESCVVCNDNKIVNAERTRCDYCPKSFGKSKETGLCVKCPSGKYSKGDNDGCRACNDVDVVNAAQTDCLPMTRAPTPVPIIRKDCLPGQGYTKTNPEVCVDCGPGYMSVTANQTCIPCGLGTYSNTARPASCITCASPKVVSADRTKCEYCEPSFYRQELPQDYPITSPGREAKCLKCPAGTYSGSGGTGCLECPDQHYPVKADQTGCSTTFVYTGPSSPPPPRAGPGKVIDPVTRLEKDCEAGYKKQFYFEACTKCEVGYYAELPASAVCKICDSSKVIVGGKSCESCLPGYTKTPHKFGDFPYTNEVEATCVKCPPNTISNGGPCTKCPTWEIPSEDQSYCTYPEYDYCKNNSSFDTDLGECVPCKAGYATFVHPCIPCLFGTYKPNAGREDCVKCPAGMATGSERVDCYFCEASFIQQSYEPYPWEYDGPPPDCVKCAPGTYSVYADTKCRTCPAGKKVNAAQTGCE